ncbi:tetratricopeptide repeat protein [Paludisphaera rhizosphaerae]|uniref:tetratricopeptide repeat protein n=1 Tax=Paludisphaera rhizosphaerae TaxID=2711216 RepID=UPI0013EB31A7|nr:tetratricopeptide repeat protein [Paludisphaera rhizosphaerae]
MGSIRCAGAARAALLGFTSVAVLLVSGCNYTPPPRTVKQTGTFSPGASAVKNKPKTKAQGAQRREDAERAAILESSIQLIKTAALKPGGDNFRLATQKLTQYFDGTSQVEYLIKPEVLRFLGRQLPRKMLEEIQATAWSEARDARHIEDCMMYNDVATRVGGTGDDLARVGRVFDWVVEQIQLVPAGSMGTPQLPQVYARPYDLLLRGMATEVQGYWAERSWLFMALCRQLGVDVGLLTYSRGNTVEPVIPKTGDALQPLGPPREDRPPNVWICAALIDGEAYLFDARAGVPVPGPGGRGVATLRQAVNDPSILEAMQLPNLSPYDVSRATLLASPTRIGVKLDSSRGYYTPKMRLLQNELAGTNRTVLYHDPAVQEEHFAKVLGSAFGGASFWTLPLEVETRLFTDPQFVAATQQSLLFFRGEMPLLYARIKQLRGDLAEAVSDYVSFRFSEGEVFVTNKNQVIPSAIQEGLDAYATYYLALAHLERKDLRQAELMFTKVLEILPEPTPEAAPYFMFRWGAHSNLARIYESQGDSRRAIAHYTAIDPTMQFHGNLLRARSLVLKDPMQEVPEPLPPAPKEFSRINASKPEAAPAAADPAAAPAAPTPSETPATTPSSPTGNPDAPQTSTAPKGSGVVE